MRALQAARNNATAYARASADLVAEITQSGGNMQLKDYIATFAQRIGRYMRIGLSTPVRRKQSFANWTRLIGAIVARDADLAEATHRRMATENMVAGLAELDRRERQERAARVQRSPGQRRRKPSGRRRGP
jgi:DNA-binding GntR family transcriptional regulator